MTVETPADEGKEGGELVRRAESSWSKPGGKNQHGRDKHDEKELPG